MHPRIIDAKAPGCPWPMCDVTTGRRDGDLVNFGEMAPVVSSAPAKDPACLVKVTRVELVAEERLGMVPGKRHEKKVAELEAKIADLEAQLQEASELPGRLREALDGTTDKETGNG